MARCILYIIVFMGSFAAVVNAGADATCVYLPMKSAKHPFPELQSFESCGGIGENNHLRMHQTHLDQMHFDADGLACVYVPKPRVRVYYVRKDGRSRETLYVDNGCDSFSDGLARTKIDGKAAFINKQLDIEISTPYTAASPFDAGYAAVCNGGHSEKRGEHILMRGGTCGYINRAGILVVPLQYSRESLPPGRSIQEAEPLTCTYSTYTWNVHEKRAVDFLTVQHPYSSLAPSEIHAATGCTVCAEDQVWIELPGVAPFRVCQALGRDVMDTLAELIESGEPIFRIVGYRVGMTKGHLDAKGNRTQFSNHAFGVALDITEQQNGLYDHCMEFGTHCRLRKGGRWDPAQRGSLAEHSPTVIALKSIGLKWGGEIAGSQKDFMHFSPSGY